MIIFCPAPFGLTVPILVANHGSVLTRARRLERVIVLSDRCYISRFDHLLKAGQPRDQFLPVFALDNDQRQKVRP